MPASRPVGAGAGQPGPPTRVVRRGVVRVTIDGAARTRRPGSRITLPIARPADTLHLPDGTCGPVRKPALVVPNGLVRRAAPPSHPIGEMDDAAPPDPVPSGHGEAERHAARRAADRWPAP